MRSSVLTQMLKRNRFLCGLVVTTALAVGIGLVAVGRAIETGDLEQAMTQAKQLMQDGNFAEAAKLFRATSQNSDASDVQVVQALKALHTCQQQLGLFASVDDDLSAAIAAHPNSFRVLGEAANQIQAAQHWGTVADQKFTRGWNGGGQPVNVTEQDRLRSLQWRIQAIELAAKEARAGSADREPADSEKSDSEPADSQKSADGQAAELSKQLAQLHLEQAQALLLGREQRYAWRLQSLTDLQAQPDYLDMDSNTAVPTRAAPVSEPGKPVLYDLPDSWQAATNDGQRLRWSLEEAQQSDGSRSQAKYQWAMFLNQQFSVDTLQQDAWLFRRGGVSGGVSGGVNDELPEQGVAAIHTLKDNETIAKLADGIHRFTLADEFNPILLLQELAQGADRVAENAAWELIQISLNRRQYPQAAERLADYLERFKVTDDWKRQLLDHIRQPRATFDAVAAQTAGQPAKLSLLFRNANQIALTARRVDVEKILRDTKAYYRNFNPQQPNDRFGKLSGKQAPPITSPGTLFDQAKIDDYLLEQVAEWNEPLEARPNHWDRRVQIETPLEKAGMYLVEGVVSGEAGAKTQTVRILVSIEDTALMQKTAGDNQWLLWAVDAVSGQAIAGANVEMFGYGWDNSQNGRGERRELIIENFSARTDDHGSVNVAAKNGLQWFSVVRGKDGRIALLGFQHFWQFAVEPSQHLELKAYGVSDRPLYRPGETIKTKFWLGYQTYGDEPAQRLTKRDVNISMIDPQGVQVAEHKVTTDEFGGCELEIPLADTAGLGRYSFQVNLIGNAAVVNPAAENPPADNPAVGRRRAPGKPQPSQVAANPASDFASTNLAVRVEEYRKPEFEVKILAPEKPVALGDTIEARIEAKYYFGTPVTEAEVNVRVERSTVRESFYPWAPYDWCFGPGYWWFAEDYLWYPNWRGWAGCIAPTPPWEPTWGHEPPELVLEQQVQLDSSGIAKLSIDTALAKAIYGDEDHKYSISVEVRDASRRTITSSGSVIAAQEPFKVYAWVDRGFYSVGQRIDAHFQARRLDDTPVTGSGTIDLLKISYDAEQHPHEQVVASFEGKTDAEGKLVQTMQADEAGQYRVRLRLQDAAGHEMEGGYIFTVRGTGSDANDYRYNALELIPDKQHYAPGDTVKLKIASNHAGARVALFLRPEQKNYAAPQWIELDGKSTVIEIPVEEMDQPNFFVEAATVFDGQYHQQVRQIVVPPSERVLDVQLVLDKEEYLPGEECAVEIKVTDTAGKPVVGSCVIAAYDRALDALAGDVLPPDIREFFWKWQRHHQPQRTSSLDTVHYPIQVADQPQLQPLGIFGGSLADDLDAIEGDSNRLEQLQDRGRGMGGMMGGMGGAFSRINQVAAPMSMGMGGGMEGGMLARGGMQKAMDFAGTAPSGQGDAVAAPPVAVRQDFADSALWLASLITDESGVAKATFKMPENLTSWQVRSWAVAPGTRVGSATSTAVTRKPLLLRLQTPRFLVERDEVVISANVHNDLAGRRRVKVSLEIDGQTQLELINAEDSQQTVEIEPHQQARIDWRCRAIGEGTVTVRAIAVTEDASDAMQLQFPVIVNGILKTDSLAGTVRDGQASSTATLIIPEQRRVEQSKLVVRLSPSLAAAMIDALPYLAEYPYGCTEQTLNRFLPSVITQRVLQRMNIDLGKLKDKRNNLNAQEVGDAAERRKRWKRFDHAAVFDEELVAEMVTAGVTQLTNMQNADGGWGWFSGLQETSSPHMTATVVRGLLIAQQNDVPIVPDVLQRGIAWLEQYQQSELQKLQNADGQVDPYKPHPDNIDALVLNVLVLADKPNPAMQQILYTQREHLSNYGKVLLALATHQTGDAEQTQMLRRNLEQFLVEDAENETAYLRGQASWWYWYDSEIEANAMYLKLLAAMEPQGQTAPRVVKYLLNNRKHATYWNSTRDTALVVEAFADYIAVSGELQPNMRAEVFLSGKRLGSVEFTPENLFDVNNTIEIKGTAVPAGEQTLEIRRTGKGNLYWNAYATNFTLEEEIAPAGLEVKIERRYYHLQPVNKSLQLPGAQANVVDTQQAGFKRTLIEDLQEVPSGELIEVELLVESKNDYEYLVIEDAKAAGLETVETQSGYFYNSGLSIYRELRDQHVGLCIRWLPRGKYSIRYQLRSEAPGTFTALPSVIQGMYAPELRGNSSDFDLEIVE